MSNVCSENFVRWCECVVESEIVKQVAASPYPIYDLLLGRTVYNVYLFFCIFVHRVVIFIIKSYEIESHSFMYPM